MVAEILVDRFAAAKSFIRAVPVADSGLAQLPAKVDFHAAKQRGEVNQPDIQVLQHAAGLLYLFDGGSQPRRRGFAPLAGFQRLRAVQKHAAHQHHALLVAMDGSLCFAVFRFERDRIPQQRFQPGDQALSFGETKALGHGAA